MLRSLAISLLVFLPAHAIAWDGYDYQNGTYVEIERGNLVRSGNDIEVYDYSTGEYHNMTIENINRYGRSVEIEVYDWNNDEYRTLDMD
jgi:hypothetical protein